MVIIPELACPKCEADLENNYNGKIVCNVCRNVYRNEKYYVNLLDKNYDRLNEEVLVQDEVALNYEKKRYQMPYSKRYHAWWTNKMLNGLEAHFERVLDNGCGIGHLHEFIPSNQIVGIDASSRMLHYASEHIESLVLGNSLELPFKSNSFTLVVCRSLLHHLTDKEKAVLEIHRVLRPGGKVVFSDTNASLISIMPRLFAKYGEHFSESHQNLSIKSFKELLEPKFNIDNLEYFGYIAYPLLGFPDLLNVFSYFPYKDTIGALLINVDKLISKVPILKTQSWGIIVKGTKV